MTPSPAHRPLPASRGRCLVALVLVAGVAGCAPEETVVSYKPFLAGLDGSSQGVSVRHGQAHVEDGEVVGGSAGAAREAMRQPIVVENDDGSVTLISKSGMHLMRHIQRTLFNEERDLFTEQVLSNMTRQEYVQRGLDPGEAFDQLKERERDIAELFARMPLAENTPQVFRTKVGHNVFRLRVTGVGVNDLYWRGFDMILEGGDWRLRWFVH